jgi:hypothetical protein
MSTGEVRLRITRKLTGSIDGIQLDRFSPGYVYLVGPIIGNYLMAIGAGVPVSDDAPALRLAPENVMFGPQQVPETAEPVDPATPTPERRRHSGTTVLPVAADRPLWRKRES